MREGQRKRRDRGKEEQLLKGILMSAATCTLATAVASVTYHSCWSLLSAHPLFPASCCNHTVNVKPWEGWKLSSCGTLTKESGPPSKVYTGDPSSAVSVCSCRP